MKGMKLLAPGSPGPMGRRVIAPHREFRFVAIWERLIVPYSAR